MKPLTSISAILVCLFLFAESATPQAAKKMPKAVDTIYLPTEPGLIKYQPSVYEGRYLRVMDKYGEKADETLISKTAVREGFDPATYLIFDTSHETSEMRCYVRLDDKRNADVAGNLVKDAQITLYGKLAWIQTSRAGKVLHFVVDRIERGWELKPVMTVELSADKQARKLYRIWEPKRYEFVYPPAKTKQEEDANAFLVDVAFKTATEKKPKATSEDGSKTYDSVDPGRIPYDPKAYAGKNLVIKDTFDTMLTAKDFLKQSEKIGFRATTHVLFRTPSTGEGSDLYCYLSKDQAFYIELAEALVKNVKITLYGTFVAYDDRSPLRIKHFSVDRLDVGWEDKATVELRFGALKTEPKAGIRIYKPGLYEIPFPPWDNTKTYTLLVKCIY